MAASTGKATFEIVYGENVMVPLDHPTSSPQPLWVQDTGEMAEEVSGLVYAVKNRV